MSFEEILYQKQKVGILGGGQLGLMLGQAASEWNLPIWILDRSRDFPAAKTCTHFVEGDFNNYQDVVDFGMQVDVISIEIEHVNVKALEYLKQEGKTIHPDPQALKIIKDKGLQKQFYAKEKIPTSGFKLIANSQELKQKIEEGTVTFPFVCKYRQFGYDGKGVVIVRDQETCNNLLDVPMVIEDLVDIQKEISVIAAKNASGEVKTFPTVEMSFHDRANLVDQLISPARVSDKVEMAAKALAKWVITALDVCGLLAVEMFLTKTGDLLVNEVAPRPHNSGHQTIEANDNSQYQQHLRAILNLPLGSTRITAPSVMVNLLGDADHQGPVKYLGLEECMKLDGVHVHIYGKADTKPFRKMGHTTIVDSDLNKAIEKAKFVKETLKSIS